MAARYFSRRPGQRCDPRIMCPHTAFFLSNRLSRAPHINCVFWKTEIVDALLKKSGESGSHAIGHEKPKYDHNGSHRKSARVHQCVKEKDIDDNGTEKS